MNPIKIKPSLWLGSFSLEGKTGALLLFAVTLLGLALRLVRLDFQPLWGDEGWSLFFATRDFSTMLERTAVDIHPPLYYALLTAWMQVAGKGEVPVRLFSVVVGAATIPLFYALGKRLFGSRVALVSALLIAIAPFHIYYSQEVRMYGLVTFLCLASVYLFVELLDSSSGLQRGPWLWLLYVLATAAALYTQYYAAFVVAFEVVVVVSLAAGWPRLWQSRQPTSPRPDLTPWPDLNPQRGVEKAGGMVRSSGFSRKNVEWKLIKCAKAHTTNQTRASWDNPSELLAFAKGKRLGVELGRWVAAWLAVAALYLPWVLYAGQKLYAYVNMKVVKDADKALDPLTYVARHLATFSVGHTSAWTWLTPLGIVALVLLLLGVFKHSENAATGLAPRTIALLYLVVPLVFGFLVNLVYPFFPPNGERLLLPAAPAFYLLVASGILVVWDSRRYLGFAALVLVAGICAASLYDFYTVPRYPNDDYRPLIANIQRQAQPGDVYLAVHPWQIGYLEAYYDGAPLAIVETPSAKWIDDPSQLDRELGALLTEHRRVWLPALQTLGAVLENAVDGYLRPRTFTVIDTWYGTTRLELFASAAEPAAASRSIVLKGNVKLDSYAVSTGPIAAGEDILPIKMKWSDPVPVGYSESLRLVDAQGYVWAQDDRGIEKGEQRIGFAIPLGTPPGEYSLSLITYRESQSPQDAVKLADVQVTRARTPNAAALPHRLSVSVGEDLKLVGYDGGDAPLEPGTITTLTLYWQAQRAPEADYRVMLRIVDGQGNVFASAESAPARGIYLTSRWQPGEIVRDPQLISLRGDTPDGPLSLLVGLSRANQESIIAQRIERAITVKGRPHYFGPPSPSVKSDVRFGDIARLAGYDMSQEKGNLHLTLYWQAMMPSSSSLQVYAHLLDGDGNIVKQKDQIPGDGAFPTTSWVKGEYLVDEYSIPLPSTPPTQIAIGMYDLPSGARLPAFDASNQPLGDHIDLPMRIN